MDTEEEGTWPTGFGEGGVSSETSGRVSHSLSWDVHL